MTSFPASASRQPESTMGRSRTKPAKLTLADLPPSDTQRWVMRRKAEVVAGVRAGLLSAEDACRRYNLSQEEFNSWQTMVERHGVRGLRVTKLQDYR